MMMIFIDIDNTYCNDDYN